MKIVIDTDKKLIEVPNDFKKAYESQRKTFELIGKKCDSILSMIEDTEDIDNFKITSKIVRTSNNSEKITAKDIENFMNSVKDTHKEKYNEYMELKNEVKKTKDGKERKTTHFEVLSWVKKNFPEFKTK